MQYAIELYYDEKTESKLMNLARKIADEKIYGEFTSIGLVKITFPVEEIFTINLSR